MDGGQILPVRFELRKVSYSSTLRQTKCLHQEDRHLGAGHIGIGTIVAVSASAGDAGGDQLFYPGGGPVISGDITKSGVGFHSGWNIAGAVSGFQEEHRHLRPGDC